MFWKALFTGWQISQVSGSERAVIGRKAYARLRAISTVIAWDSEWVFEDGDIRTRKHGVGDWQYWACDIADIAEFERLLVANEDEPLDTLEQRTYDECPQRYAMDGRRVSLRPTFNVKYSHKGVLVDLGAISA